MGRQAIPKNDIIAGKSVSAVFYTVKPEWFFILKDLGQ